MLLNLFLSFVYIGAFSFGGGLAALPLIQEQVVEMHSWMSINEFTDLISIAEMTPGPIAINSATFVGIRLAGLKGAFVATLGCLLPSLLIVTILAFLYFKYKELNWVKGLLAGLRPAVVAMIAAAGVAIFKIAISPLSNGLVNYVAIILFAFVLVLLRWKKINPILMLMASGVLGIVIYYFIGV
ncbi:MAG: chromate transporter [Sphaerochaetaceae bacterium]|nr:chromate transporter [Sphaerochaetaceae bacterium]